MKSWVATILVASAALIWVDMSLPGGEARVPERQNLRWGRFVCGSFSTFSGKEWTPGVTNIELFHPTGCDPEPWFKTAKEARMPTLREFPLFGNQPSPS